MNSNMTPILLLKFVSIYLHYQYDISVIASGTDVSSAKFP